MRRLLKREALALLEEEARRLPACFNGCAMCAMAQSHPAELETVAATGDAVVVVDRYSSRRGHLLVVLRRHVESFTELTWSEHLAVQRLTFDAARTLEAVLGARRVFAASLGSARQLPMSFPHHHVHVVPLFRGDESDRPAEVFSWSAGVEIYEPGDAKALAATLRQAWPSAA